METVQDDEPTHRFITRQSSCGTLNLTEALACEWCKDSIHNAKLRGVKPKRITSCLRPFLDENMDHREKRRALKYNEIHSFLGMISNNSTLTNNDIVENNFIVKIPFNLKNYNCKKAKNDGLQTPPPILASLIETSSSEISIRNTDIERVSASVKEKKTMTTIMQLRIPRMMKIRPKQKMKLKW